MPLRKLYDVTFEDIAVSGDDVLAVGDSAHAALARSMDVGTVTVCADMLGGMQWILEDAVEYAKTRQQFGKPIGSFQAVQHMCADMLLWTESSRSAIYFAAWALDAEPESAQRAWPRPRFTPPTRHAKSPTAASKSTAASASPGNTTCSFFISGPKPQRFSSAMRVFIAAGWPIWYLLTRDRAGRLKDEISSQARRASVGNVASILRWRFGLVSLLPPALAPPI